MAELKDTLTLMLSDDYKDRFIAEYLQTRVRLGKLEVVINSYYSGQIKFDCPVFLLEKQFESMRDYLCWLEIRAKYEDIDLDSILESLDRTPREIPVEDTPVEDTEDIQGD